MCFRSIEGRPFLIELQGSLSASDGSDDMRDVQVGKLDLLDPVLLLRCKA